MMKGAFWSEETDTLDVNEEELAERTKEIRLVLHSGNPDSIIYVSPSLQLADDSYQRAITTCALNLS